MNEDPGKGGSHAPGRRRSREIRDHRDLRVWRKSRRLAALCHARVAGFGESGTDVGRAIAGLADQIPEEIQAGQAERNTERYLTHLDHCEAALRQLERRLMDAYQLGVLAAADGDPLLARTAEIRRMLGKLIDSLEAAWFRRTGKPGIDSADVR